MPKGPAFAPWFAFFCTWLSVSDYKASHKLEYLLQYYEEIGKPTPKVEVMKFLKEKHYLDAKNFAGECEAVVVVAKGQGNGVYFNYSSSKI